MITTQNPEVLSLNRVACFLRSRRLLTRLRELS